jgi:UDP-N-acetylglucosamine transferase subunit ALG13
VIFLTVGTHEPFDRLVRAVDEWCSASDCGDLVFGQITKRADHLPSSFQWEATLDPGAYRTRFEDADVIVSHAGMGSIITAMSLGKPIVIVPRRAHLGETRNDHQVGTAERFGTRPGVHVAWDVDELIAWLDEFRSGAGIGAGTPIPAFADESLIKTIREFIFENEAHLSSPV